MVLIIIGVLIAVLVIVIVVKRDKRYALEHNELKETIRNSEILKKLREELQVLVFRDDCRWSHEQIDYYDECKRDITIFNLGISFSIWQNSKAQSLYYLDFVEDLGYRPLLDNELQMGKQTIKNEDIYRAFALEVSKIVEELFHNDKIEFSWPEYYDGFSDERQPDGSFRRIRVGDEHATVKYNVPKTVGAKKM